MRSSDFSTPLFTSNLTCLSFFLIISSWIAALFGFHLDVISIVSSSFPSFESISTSCADFSLVSSRAFSSSSHFLNSCSTLCLMLFEISFFFSCNQILILFALSHLSIIGLISLSSLMSSNSCLFYCFHSYLHQEYLMSFQFSQLLMQCLNKSNYCHFYWMREVKQMHTRQSHSYFITILCCRIFL